MRLLAAFAFVAVLNGLGVAPGHAEKRVALVIGNDRYANLPADQQLKKAVNDARAVGNALGIMTRIIRRVRSFDHFLDGQQLLDRQVRSHDALEFAENDVDGVDLFSDVELRGKGCNFTGGLEFNARVGFRRDVDPAL